MEKKKGTLENYFIHSVEIKKSFAPRILKLSNKYSEVNELMTHCEKVFLFGVDRLKEDAKEILISDSINHLLNLRDSLKLEDTRRNPINDFIKILEHYLKESKKEDESEIKHPFKNDETFYLFNYIVNNWNYDKQQKWADIWNAINDSDLYHAPYPNEYRSYIIKRFGYTGKFQFDKLKKSTNRNQIDLDNLIKSFSKK